jgi:hypothetical protein
MQALIKKSGALVLVLFTLFAANSCKKESGPNVLGGETNIPLTQKDSVTDLYFTVNGGSSLPGASIKVLSNDNGMVTYGATVDLNAYPDSVVNNLVTMVPQLITYYKPKDLTWSLSPGGVLNVQFKLKITSEGMQNYFVDGQPWTVKYADGVGTDYTVTRDNGDVLKATITEKTGLDDWPYSFWSIKTSKVEYNAPATDPVLSKVTFRVNHKFGLVYLKAEGKDGRVLEMDLFAWFLL